MRIPTGWSSARKVWSAEGNVISPGSPEGKARGHLKTFSPPRRLDYYWHLAVSSVKTLVLQRERIASTMSCYLAAIIISAFSLSLDMAVGEITDHESGYWGRVNYVKAVISSSDLDTGSQVGELAQTFFRKLVANGKNDIPAQLIPRRLGGTGTETYNIAPMNERSATFYKRKVEDPIYEAVSGGATVTLEVWPRYEGTEATRPVRFEAKATQDDGTAVVDNAVVENPPTA
ncbi:hypothetical protein GE061_004618 [Apolygus lucorum]|uniref:Uncharacterized protein n=1 Tax=Apolygus lucorum TaxID=248454 RepID=A0A8S9WZ81_APOLU|nr:hypothetical protein GE061_004618 [Apolygus lucorum]